ncbi:hypothetical protein [Pseudonocardia humida]|nr:hypothetical protein [Pseudonocardia humida]
MSAARRARDAAGDKDVMVLGAHVAGELIPVGTPVAGTVTHLRYRVPKP